MMVEISSLTSDEQDVLRKIMDIFGNKPFLRHQTQVFDQFTMVNAYKCEEMEFLKLLKP